MTPHPQQKYVITEIGMNLAIAALKSSRQYDIAESVLKEIHPAPSEQEIRKDELVDFDRWFSRRHVGGQSPIIVEVRQELHRRIFELRSKQGEP